MSSPGYMSIGDVEYGINSFKNDDSSDWFVDGVPNHTKEPVVNRIEVAIMELDENVDEKIELVDVVVESTNNYPFIHGLPLRYYVYAVIVNTVQILSFLLYMVDNWDTSQLCLNSSYVLLFGTPIVATVVSVNVLNKISQSEVEYLSHDVFAVETRFRRPKEHLEGYGGCKRMVAGMLIVTSYVVYILATGVAMAKAPSFSDLLLKSLSLFFILKIDTTVGKTFKLEIVEKRILYADCRKQNAFKLVEDRTRRLCMCIVFYLNLVTLCCIVAFICCVILPF